MERMGMVIFGAVFVDIKGYPLSRYIPGGRNVGRVVQTHGGVTRNVAEDIGNVELRPTFISVVTIRKMPMTSSVVVSPSLAIKLLM